MLDCQVMSTKEEMLNVNVNTKVHALNDKWVLYHHLPSDKNWTLSGYTVLDNDISSVEHIIALRDALPEKMIKYSNEKGSH